MWKCYDPTKREWTRWCPRGASPGAPRWALERFGYKCRSFKPTVYRRFKRKIWQEVEDQESGRRSYQRGDDEFESVAPSLHFAEAETVRRLVEWAKAEYVRRLADLGDLPDF